MDQALAIQNSISYLASPEALASIERDPYWPKWDSPWWHMSLLFELGLAEKIPHVASEKMVAVLKTHYLPIFPVKEDEIPAGIDPRRQVACFCAVGCIYQVLHACGVDVDAELPWMRKWFLNYQLPDGGLNCDESAYAKTNPRSSIVTTLPCLEAILFCTNRDLTEDEIEFLNQGAEFLLKHKLFRRLSNGEVFGLISKQIKDENIVLKHYNLIDKRSYNPLSDSKWGPGEASEFELLKAVSYDGAICAPLTKKWKEVR